MPRNAMEKLLQEIGEDAPELDDAAKAQAKQAAAVVPGGFVCKRTGRPGTKMPAPPFKGPIGAWIYENISAETFHEWIKQGTKVINELRLDLSREQDEKAYDQHMYEYLGMDEELLKELRGKQNA
jgi:Fe-S cluster biosynthesis and repair protein YggX